MKRIGFIRALGLLCLLSCLTEPAEAQFLKKLFGRKQRKSAPANPKTINKPVTTPKKVKAPSRRTQAEQLDYPRSRIKSRYRVDLLVPLYLNDLVKNGKAVNKDRIPDKAVPGITFYEGMQLAADTLDKFGYQIDLYVHDITDPLETTEALITARKLDSSDLIIGAVQAHQVSALAQYAKKRKVNFISVLSPSDGNVRDNPYFTLLQPTLQTNCDWIRRTVAAKYRQDRVLVYHRPGMPTDELAYKSILRPGELNFQEIDVTALPKLQLLRPLLDSSSPNVILMPILDAEYAAQLLLQLNTSFPDYQFEVYGMPSWKGMPQLRKANALGNIAIYLTAPFYFDPSTSSGQHLASHYNQVFGGKPSELVYRGYETLYWYAYLLNRYGNIFNENMADNGAALFTRFDIRPRWDKDENLLYNENGHLYLFRYQGGSYSVEQ